MRGTTRKTRRVRATGRVRFAPCNANGRRILGEWQEATGHIVHDAPERSPGGLAASMAGNYLWRITVPDAAKAETLFAALAEGGQVQMPLTKTFWSPRFGMVADRFGVSWMINVAH